MDRLGVLGLMFFVMESSSRPMHSGAIMLFDPPQDGSAIEVVEQTVAAFRETEPVAPWNQRAALGLGSLPHWETVPQVDLDYHVRRIALPAPGSMAQLMDLVSQLYPAPLDRSRPLWEAYVVEGLEHGRMALFFKGHHAAVDGASAVHMLLASLSEAPSDDPRAPWAVAAEPRAPLPTLQPRGGAPVIGGPIRRLEGFASAAPKVAKLLPAVVRLARSGVAPPFSGADTQTMGAGVSAARSFATLTLSLDEVKRVAKSFGGTVNDVLLSVCDAAMHRYSLELGGTKAGRMVSVMLLSTRAVGNEAAGNEIAALLVALGAPEATPVERLTQIVNTTKRIKSVVRRTDALPLQLTMLTLLMCAELREDMPIGRGRVPNVSNLAVSNLPAGPQHELFLGQAKLAGLYAAPIVAASTPANFTVMSYHGSLCVGIAAARNIIPDTNLLAKLATRSFDELRACVPTGDPGLSKVAVGG